MSDYTTLRIIGHDLAPFSSRGIKEERALASEGFTDRRAINGTLIGVRSFDDKYEITYTGDDAAPASFGALKRGDILTVHVIGELSQPGTLPVVPGDWTGNTRPIVPGSLHQDGNVIRYRPILTMMVIDCPASFDEWAASFGWSMTLREV